MKSTFDRDVKRVLDLLTVMAEELRDDVTTNMEISFRAMMDSNASLDGALEMVNRTIDCDARTFLQGKLTEAVEATVNRYCKEANT